MLDSNQHLSPQRGCAPYTCVHQAYTINFRCFRGESNSQNLVSKTNMYASSITKAWCPQVESNHQTSRLERDGCANSPMQAFLSLQLELHQHQQFRRLLSLSVRRWRRFNTFTSLFSGTTRFIKVASFYFFAVRDNKVFFLGSLSGSNPILEFNQFAPFV